MIREKRYSTASELLNALDVRVWTDDKDWFCPYVFRGQSDATWSLIPAAWRNGESDAQRRIRQLRERVLKGSSGSLGKELDRSKLRDKVQPDRLLLAYAQACAERALLADFLEAANEIGFPIPDLESELQRVQGDPRSNIGSDPLHFMPEISSAQAIAQHHNVPTRALDFTNNPLFAAYFAASGVGTPDGRLAVFALNANLLSNLSRLPEHSNSLRRFIKHSFPFSDNPYLSSQQGVLVHPTYACAHIAATGEFPSLEAFATEISDAHPGANVLQTLTLPCDQAGELLRLLWLRRISRAHLMPTLDNVTLSIATRWKWEA